MILLHTSFSTPFRAFTVIFFLHNETTLESCLQSFTIQHLGPLKLKTKEYNKDLILF